MNNPAREAIEVLAKKGWTKHQLEDQYGRHCILGALWETESICLQKNLDTVDVLGNVIKEQFPDRVHDGGCVPSFNDHQDTTIDDVILVLEKTAVKIDEVI